MSTRVVSALLLAASLLGCAGSSDDRRVHTYTKPSETPVPTVRPPGHIVFVSEREGEPQIYRLEPGGEPTPVIRVPGSGYPAAPGPRGQVLILSSSGHDDDAKEQLLLQQGDALVPLVPPTRFVRNPTWVPDGNSVVIESNHDGFRNLFQVATNGEKVGHMTQLTDCTNGCFEPAVAPDGSDIAYASPDSGDGEIYVMSLDGTNSRRLTWSKGTDRSPTWSPDGNRLAFVSSRRGVPEVFLMGSAGEQPTPLIPARDPKVRGTQDVTWSPDGSLIARTVLGEKHTWIEVVRVADGAVVSSTQGAWKDQTPTFDPSGEHIAFSSNREGSTDLFMMRSDGSGLRRMTRDRAAEWLPRWVD